MSLHMKVYHQSIMETPFSHLHVSTLCEQGHMTSSQASKNGAFRLDGKKIYNIHSRRH